MHAPVGERLSKKLPFDRNSVKLKFLLHLNQRNLQSEWSGTELRPPFADVPHGSARNARAPQSDTHRTAKTRCLSYRPICCRERRLPQAVSSLALSVVIGFRLTRRDRIRRAIAWCDRPARRSFHYRKPAQSRRRRRLARLARLGAILEDSMDAIFILFASRPQQRRCSVGQNGSPVLFAGCVNQREPSTVM